MTFNKQKKILLLLSVPLSLCGFMMSTQVSTPAAEKPNIIFILADDLGYGDLGAYGQKKIKTPNLDKMAANGMKFTDFYTGNTVCAPSRCALMTGKHMGHAYIRGNGEIPLRAEDVIIAQKLKTAGYRTGMFGKWGLGVAGTPGAPNLKGWDSYFGLTHHVDAHFQQPDTLWQIKNKALVPVPNPAKAFANELFTQHALTFMQEKSEQPFFMYLAFTIPHAELRGPQRVLNAYMDGSGKSVFAPEKPWKDGQHYGGQPNPKAAYAGLVTAVDDYVGLVLMKLEEMGMAENTIVMFASDNGTHLEGGRNLQDVEFFASSGPLKGVKRDMYDGGIRTPFLVQWKSKIAPASTTNHVGAFWDVAATAYELAGLPATKDTDGVSFVPTLLQKNQPKHEYLYWEFYERGFDQAVRMGDWKAVKRSQNGGKIELYNMKTDIQESKDVAAANPAVVSKMENVLKEAHVKSEIFPLAKKK
ncbi:arylsulfatase [Arundinibacter roseus]|uniref:Chloramphenicol resistance protein n=1 Tax=Arundinibacter roseus TaxID=2070510 RepID=A0A4V6P8Q9_9BACT|nr:arylsulfatase [Arundinibacter roseus]TDB67905.1 chloramphenicol resistance protein [Arundinibacter roseus]